MNMCELMRAVSNLSAEQQKELVPGSDALPRIPLLRHARAARDERGVGSLVDRNVAALVPVEVWAARQRRTTGMSS